MQPINWLENGWKVTCDVNFIRGTPITGAGYRPHLVAEGNSEYIGVTFLHPLAIGENKAVQFKPLYPDVDFRPLLIRGIKFEIKEGARTVGTGVVTFIKDKYSSQ